MSTFVKEDAQIGEDCRRTISYLQGVVTDLVGK